MVLHRAGTNTCFSKLACYSTLSSSKPSKHRIFSLRMSMEAGFSPVGNTSDQIAAYQWSLMETACHLLLWSPSCTGMAISSIFLHCYIQGTGSSCSSCQLHQDWISRKHQILFCSVFFGTNPFEISFSSESDVTLLPNLLVTSLITFPFFAAGTPQSLSPNHSAIPA